MTTVKNRFLMSGFWAIIIPIIGIVATGIVLITCFFILDPDRTAYIFVPMKILHDPFFQKYIMIWAACSVLITLISSVCIVINLSQSLMEPIKSLKLGADKIRAGELDFEIMNSKYEELNELCTAFELMRKRLQEMQLTQTEYEQERNQLIANISHDLRTPITSIKGYAQGIMDGIAGTEEKKNKYLQTIYQKAETLEELVSGMSEYSKYESGVARYDFSIVDMSVFLERVAEQCRTDLESYGIELKCQISQGKYTVLMDTAKMNRVFFNIVGNAVKYRSESSSFMIFGLEPMHSGVCVTITDDGMGINNEDISKVFDSHFRSDKSRTSQVRGQGLGLSISKQIVNAHKGKIWLTSREKTGTTVHVYLPLLDSENGMGGVLS